MKERFFDVIKWGLIIAMVAVAFYIVYPRYHFIDYKGAYLKRCNTITGKVERYSFNSREMQPWKELK